MPVLVALLGEDVVGTLEQARGAATFRYEAAWRARPDVYPLSLSMPLAAVEHRKTVAPYLWGLLPDNELILDRWAKMFHVSARSPFSLIEHVGEDCAGAVAFVSEPRVASGAWKRGNVDWIDRHAVAERLRDLRHDAAAWRRVDDAGQFSLAGAQPKTALIRDGNRWGIPSGRTPTTHILKPGMGELAGHAVNEHFCLALARALSLPVADSTIEYFGDEVAIVLERYDRYRTGTRIERVHQEDACQALSVSPLTKYENEGGPGAARIVALLREYSRKSEEDIWTFIDALVLNWLIVGTDAHAKNYSLLIGAGGKVRLAPLYDVASVLPYVASDLHKVKLAMKVGGKYRVREIGRHQWSKLASELRLGSDEVLARVRAMAVNIGDAALTTARELKDDGLDDAIIGTLSTRIAARAKACVKALE